MKYSSTRGGGAPVTASEAIVKGLAFDGGLFVPNEFPAAPAVQALSTMSYRARAKAILSLFLTDFTAAEVEACVGAAYTKEKFETEDIAPLYKLDARRHILELWHGPTCAFKDMALQILPHLLTVSMKKNGVAQEVAILVATSGDTGKAALEGFKDVAGTRIIVFFPQDGVSNIQKLQMVTQDGKNVGVAAVQGNFDDAQNGVKAIFTDAAYNDHLRKNGIVLSSANSINWGRLAPQIVYYLSAWAELAKGGLAPDEKINIVVPTGNFGNILAAYYACKMGFPIGKLICASNANNVLTDFIRTGTYDRNRAFHVTTSPSMDILISSNLERFLYDVTGRDTEKINTWMRSLKESGNYTVDADTKKKMDDILWAGYCDDAATLDTIRKTSQAHSYVPDTHTAVALQVYDQYVAATGDTRKTVIASTASPYKFGASVLRAMGEPAQENDFVTLKKVEEYSGMTIPASLWELQNKAVRFETVCAPEAMRQTVDTLLGIE